MCREPWRPGGCASWEGLWRVRLWVRETNRRSSNLGGGRGPNPRRTLLFLFFGFDGSQMKSSLFCSFTPIGPLEQTSEVGGFRAASLPFGF